MASPGEKEVTNEVEFVTGKRVYPYVALAGPLLRLIRDVYGMHERGETFYVRPICPPEIQRKAGCLPRDSGTAVPASTMPGGQSPADHEREPGPVMAGSLGPGAGEGPGTWGTFRSDAQGPGRVSPARTVVNVEVAGLLRPSGEAPTVSLRPPNDRAHPFSGAFGGTP